MVKPQSVPPPISNDRCCWHGPGRTNLQTGKSQLSASAFARTAFAVRPTLPAAYCHASLNRQQAPLMEWHSRPHRGFTYTSNSKRLNTAGDVSNAQSLGQSCEICQGLV